MNGEVEHDESGGDESIFDTAVAAVISRDELERRHAELRRVAQKVVEDLTGHAWAACRPGGSPDAQLLQCADKLRAALKTTAVFTSGTEKKTSPRISGRFTEPFPGNKAQQRKSGRRTAR